MSSYSQEGESITYGKLLDEFDDDITAYKDKQKENTVHRKGVARFV